MARRYVRDAKGRFAPKGYSGQTGGRGARLKGGKGNVRSGGGAKIKTAAPKGTIGKSKDLKPQSSQKLKAGLAVSRLKATNAKMAGRPDMAAQHIPGRFRGQAAKRMDASIDRAVKQVKAAEMARLMKPKAQVKAERAARAEAKRQAAAAKPKRVRSSESLRMSRAKRIVKEREMKTSGTLKQWEQSKQTQERALAFYKSNRKQGGGTTGKIKPASKPKSVESLNAARQKANANLDQKRAAYFGTKYGTQEQKKARAELLAAEKKSNAATNAWRDAKAGIKSDTPKGSYAATKIEQAKGRVKQFTTAKKSVDAEIRQVRQQIKDARSNAMTFGDVPALKLKLLTLRGKSQEYKATIERAKRQAKGE
jgi:hypothetical protein